MTRMALQPGDTIQVGDGDANLLAIVRRLRRGWLVRPHGGDATEELDDVDLAVAYNDRVLRHWPCDLSGFDERTAAKLKTTFDAYPPHCQRECLRKLAFVEAVANAMDAHPTVLAAAAAVIPRIWSERQEGWLREERDAAVAAAAGRRRRDGVEPDAESAAPKRIAEPKPSTVRDWYSIWDGAGRVDVLLMPDYAMRGDRTPRFPVAVTEDQRDTYQLMEEAAKGAYLDLLRRSKQVAFEVYQRLCVSLSIPEVSSRTFRRFLKRHYDDYERCAKREGKKAAWLRFGIFAMRDLPDRPLEEVEVDHCLVDLIVVDEGGRPIGRPWITVLLDRATKCVVGVHVSFMPPSFLTIQRALAHALYEKDLSAFPGLKNGWPCYGLVEWLISDRGKEFLSRSFRTACLLLHVYPIALPGRKPWLKGAVERIFRTLHARVFDLHEGSTKAWNADVYNSAKRARVKRSEFDRMLVEWIVDDHHQTPHPALRRKFGRDTTPEEAWTKLVERFGVRFAPDPQLAFRLTGEIFERKILSTGVHIKGLVYVDKALLERLLRTPGGRERVWTFRRDRADLGRIWVLVDREGWLEIVNLDLDLFDGVSEQQYAIWRGEAGDDPSIDDLHEARRRVEETRAKTLGGGIHLPSALRMARYGEMSATFTPVPGFGAPAALLTTTSAQLALPAPCKVGGGEGEAEVTIDPEGVGATDDDEPKEVQDHPSGAGPLADGIDAAMRRMLEEMSR